MSAPSNPALPPVKEQEPRTQSPAEARPTTKRVRRTQSSEPEKKQHSGAGGSPNE